MTRLHRFLALGAAAVLAAGCGGSTDPADSADDASPDATSTPDTSSAATSSSSGGESPRSTGTPSGSAAPNQPSACVTDTVAALDAEQRAGQLLMAALMPVAGRTGLDQSITGEHLGNMLYLGGWSGAAEVAATSTHLQDIAPTIDGTRIGLLVAADQEGGVVQQLTGDGFSTMPSGVEQGALTSPELRAAATTWGKELSAAGINVNLAPVADTVPEEIGTANAPIGQHGRQYGSTPASAGRGATAFARGMLAADVQPVSKHFPGLGRVTGNTDHTADGIIDDEATSDDPYLEPFAETIAAGTRIVMIGSATYPELDEREPALFSSAIVTDLLREQMGFDGVVITDDVGAAKSVAAYPVADRATKVIAAGGDMVLTADPSQVPTMIEAITSEAAADDDFADQVEASTTRVLTLKEEMGLLDCGGS